MVDWAKMLSHEAFKVTLDIVDEPWAARLCVVSHSNDVNACGDVLRVTSCSRSGLCV